VNDVTLATIVECSSSGRYVTIELTRDQVRMNLSINIASTSAWEYAYCRIKRVHLFDFKLIYCHFDLIKYFTVPVSLIVLCTRLRLLRLV